MALDPVKAALMEKAVLMEKAALMAEKTLMEREDLLVPVAKKLLMVRENCDCTCTFLPAGLYFYQYTLKEDERQSGKKKQN